METKVEKKDGSTEDFNMGKLTSSMTKAGASKDEANDIAEKVRSWITELTKDVVKTSEIRTKILELLRPVNGEAATAYENYKKS